MLLHIDAQDIILGIKNGLKIDCYDGIRGSYDYGKSVLKLGTESGSFTAEHELGHFKDKLYGTSQNQSIKDIYEKELLKVDNRDKLHVLYFLDASHGGLTEIVAEVNAMQNSNSLNGGSVMYIRTAMLQKYFPETIAAIINYQNKQE